LGIFVGTGFALPLPDGSIYDTYLHPNDNELVQRDDDVIGEPRLSDYYYLSTPTQQYGDNEIVTGVGGDTKIEAIVGYIDGTSYDTITLGFASTDFGIIDGRDIRFAFTCGNDVIAPASVPEPTTMFLLGIGLIGLAGVGRRKFKKS
jgi:hypothetical protein